MDSLSVRVGFLIFQRAKAKACPKTPSSLRQWIFDCDSEGSCSTYSRYVSSSTRSPRLKNPLPRTQKLVFKHALVFINPKLSIFLLLRYIVVWGGIAIFEQINNHRLKSVVFAVGIFLFCFFLCCLPVGVGASDASLRLSCARRY